MPLMKLSAWARLILWLSVGALLPAQAAQLRVDHVTIAGQELGPMQAALEKLGLHVEYGGPHANHVTEMALASFADGSYVELIAFQKNADPAAAAKHYWAKYMRGNAGPCAWAVRSNDVSAEANRLRAAGIHVSAPNQSGRTRPDGYRLEWETAQVGDQGDGIFFPFLIRDFTPREKRAFPSGKPGNPDFAGIVRVGILVSDLDAAIAQYRKAYGLAEPDRTRHDRRFQYATFTGTPVELLAPAATPDPAAKRRLEEFGPGVWIVEVQRAGSKEILSIQSLGSPSAH